MKRRVWTMMLATIAASFSAGIGRSAENFHLREWPASLPAPDFHLTDADGKRRRIADYHGKVVVTFFGFAHCSEVCPTALATLARVMTGLGDDAGAIQVLFVTLDPDRDSPRALKSYLRNFDARFVGLTGSHNDINQAAESFSVQFAKVGEGDTYGIDHSSGIYVCDRSGHLRLVGNLGTPVAEWVHDLRLML